MLLRIQFYIITYELFHVGSDMDKLLLYTTDVREQTLICHSMSVVLIIEKNASSEINTNL